MSLVWQRLDPRSMIVTPIRVVRQNLFPIILGGVGFGVTGRHPALILTVTIVGALAVGTLPWLSTKYAVSDSHLEVVRGLLGRRTQRVAIDRVRAVDVETPLLHRALGLAIVKIGTGVDSDRIELNAVSNATASELKILLLQLRADVAPADLAPADRAQTQSTDPHEPIFVGDKSSMAPEEIMVVGDPRWVRYAPLAFGRLAAVGAAVVGLMQLPFQRYVSTVIDFLTGWMDGPHWIGSGITLALSGLIGWVGLAAVAHFLQWGNLRITRQTGTSHQAATIHHSAGLLNVRSVSIDDDKVRGIELSDSLPLRWVGAAAVSAPTTGVGMTKSIDLLPAVPLADAHAAAAAVLNTDLTTIATPLRQHGPAARRRQYVPRLDGLVVLASAGFGLSAWLDWWGWLAIGVAIWVVWAPLSAELRYRSLGHALSTHFLHSRSGAWDRTLSVVERDSIISWVLTQTWWQRRVGLVTVTATYAAGKERVDIRDVPAAWACDLMAEATPMLVEPIALV